MGRILASLAIALPVAVFVVIGLRLRGRGLRVREAVLWSSVACAAIAVVMAELLSLANSVAPGALACGWGATLAALVFRLRRGLAAPKAAQGQGASAFERSLQTSAVVLFVLTGLVAIIAPPNTRDVLTYHLPRLVHWLQNGAVGPYATNDLRQAHMAPGAEILDLHAYALWGGDRLVNLVQAICFVLSAAVAVPLLVEDLGGSRRAAALAMVLAASIPQGVLQASGAKNDWVLTYWILAATHGAMGLGAAPAAWRAVGVGGACGLALATKSTAYLLLPPLLLAAAWTWPRAAFARVARWTPLAVGAAVLLLAPHLVQNFRFSGRPLGLRSGEFGYQNTTHAPAAILSNLVRNAALHFVGPSEKVNRRLEGAVRSSIALAGADPDDPRTTWTDESSDGRFHLRWQPFAEEVATNPLHAAAAVLSLVAIALLGGLRRQRRLGALALGTMAGFLLFCAVLKWQPWHARLHLPLFAVGAALVALVADRLPTAAVAVPSFVLVLWAGASIVGHQTRPLWRPDRASILVAPRPELRFYDRPALRSPFTAAARLVRAGDCRDVGLHTVVNTPEYLLLHEMGATGLGEVRVRHLGVTNLSGRLSPASEGPPCALVCVLCSPDDPLWKLAAAHVGPPHDLGLLTVFARGDR